MIDSLGIAARAELSVSELKFDCLLAEKFFGLAWAGITLMTLRQKGEQAIMDLGMVQFRDHQSDHFLEGMKKLGIEGDPPAVAAAKYHYLSNILGGLRLEYVEETSKKVWVRYLGPNWAYPGLAMLSISGSSRRNTAAWWHRRNGKLMGCPRLEWVSTKCIADGDPYDEGYFIEHDHDVDLDAPLKIELVDSTPEFDPRKAPRLDPDEWPEERRLKARRSFPRGYLFSAFRALTKLYGEVTASWLLEETMRRVAIQYTHEFRQQMGIESSGIDSTRAFILGILRACGQNYELLDDSSNAFSIRVAPPREFQAFSSDRVHGALFSFYAIAVRMLDGHTRASRVPEEGNNLAVWHFKDEGRWLW